MNGVPVYGNQLHNENNVIRSPGESWVVMQPINITTEDTVVIELHKIYKHIGDYTFKNFFSSMYTGLSKEVIRELISQEKYRLFFDFIILAIGVVLLIVTWSMKITRKYDMHSFFLLSEFIFVSGCWFLIKCDSILYLISNPTLCSTLDVILQYAIALSAVLYVKSICTSYRRICMKICEIGLCFYIIFTTVIHIFTYYDFFDFINISIVLNMILLFMMLTSLLSETIIKKKKELLITLVCSIPIIIGYVLEWVNIYIEKLPISRIFSISFLFFTLLQLTFYLLKMKQVADKAENEKRMEMELNKNKIAIMLSQIQPHFLYNSLSAIHALCKIDPDTAADAIEEFAAFLRGNIDALKSMENIPFRKELKHVKHYVKLEKMRFEERLNIEYQLEEQDFDLPTLTLQPIVENAVRYGVTKRLQGGTVTIKTYKDCRGIIITVEDDGVGFDPYQKHEDGRTHIGIENVRSRIENQCGGKMKIDSIVDKGTKVEIILPSLTKIVP